MLIWVLSKGSNLEIIQEFRKIGKSSAGLRSGPLQPVLVSRMDKSIWYFSDLSPRTLIYPLRVAVCHWKQLVLRSYSRSSLLTAHLVSPAPWGAGEKQDERWRHGTSSTSTAGLRKCLCGLDSAGRVPPCLITTFKRDTKVRVSPKQALLQFHAGKVLTDRALRCLGRHVATKMDVGYNYIFEGKSEHIHICLYPKLKK